MSVRLQSGSGNNLATIDASGSLAVAVTNPAPLQVAANNPLPVSASTALPVTVGNTVGVSAAAALPVTVGNTVGVSAAAALPVTVGNTVGVSAAAALPVLVTDNARTSVIVSGTALAVAATGVEQALSLQLARGAAVNTATSFAIPAGKILRVQTLVLTAIGSATATSYAVTVRMRYNANGAVTTTSTPILLPVRLSSPASAYGYCQAVVPIPDEWWLPIGDGTASYGFTVNATYTTNAPTVDVQLIGFEL